MERFEQSVAVPAQKSFVNQLVALKFLEKVRNYVIVKEENLKF